MSYRLQRDQRNRTIPAYCHLAARTQFAPRSMAWPSARAYRHLSAIPTWTAVKPSASLTAIARIIWPVSISTVGIRVQAYAALMRVAKSSITFQYVLACQDSPGTRSDPAKWRSLVREQFSVCVHFVLCITRSTLCKIHKTFDLKFS